MEERTPLLALLRFSAELENQNAPADPEQT